MRKIFTVVLGLILLTGCSPKGCPTMGGQSNVAYLQKIQDGTVFSDGFENDNFIAAEGWTVLQGVPANTSTQYLPSSNGIRSWDNQANAQSIPVAKKIITDTTKVNQTALLLQVWFYDTMDITSPGPYLKVKFSTGNFVSVGIRNSVSTTKYAFADPSPSTDAPNSAAQIFPALRTQGWHSFEIINGTILIDKTVIEIFTAQAGKITEIYLCADTVGGPGPSFGYFDNLGYYTNNSNLIYFDSTVANGNMKLYNANCALLASTGPGASPSSLTIPNIVLALPQTCFLEASGTQSTQLLLRTNSVNINPGDIFQLKVVSPGQKFNPYKPQLQSLSDINQSTSGNTETIFNAYKNKYRFGVQMLEGMSFKDQIDNWYNYAVQGGPFSIQVDNTNVGFGVIDSNPAVGTNMIQIKPNLSTHPTDAFTVGRKYVLFNAANTRRQVVNLQAINDPCLAFVESIDYPFVNLDYIADITFNPFLELGNNPYGLQTLDERYVRFRWDQTVQDWNNG